MKPKTLLAAVAALFGLTPGPDPDGFGQSIADDLRFLARLRACRRMPVEWRRPSPDEERSWDAHPVVGRFGDFTSAVAEVAGRVWVVRDRCFSGWPDPPEYVFFALTEEAIWCAADFDRWPRRWQAPPVNAG